MLATRYMCMYSADFSKAAIRLVVPHSGQLAVHDITRSLFPPIHRSGIWGMTLVYKKTLITDLLNFQTSSSAKPTVYSLIPKILCVCVCVSVCVCVCVCVFVSQQEIIQNSPASHRRFGACACSGYQALSSPQPQALGPQRAVHKLLVKYNHLTTTWNRTTFDLQLLMYACAYWSCLGVGVSHLTRP